MKKTKLFVALILAVIMVAAIALVACTPTEQHKCEHVCPQCQKCLTDCADEACKDKCQGHGSEEHVCAHKCSVCGKCTDTACSDAVCSDKCQGHQAEMPTITVSADQQVYNNGDFVFTADAKGKPVSALQFDGVTVPADKYVYENGSVTVKEEYMAALSAKAGIVVKFTTTVGSATATFTVNDAPSIADKTDFIKLPGEKIISESFVELVNNKIGTLTLTYALKQGDEAKGTLTDNNDGSFDFVPNGTFAGEVRIELTARDQYGLSANKTITLTYKTVNPVIYDANGEKVVDKKDDFGDVVMTVDTFGTESNTYYFDMTDITLDGISIGSENFVLKANGENKYFSVKASYLSSLAPAKYTFTLHTVAGSAPFVIEVRDTRNIEVSVTHFDFVRGVTADNLVVTVTAYSHTVTADSFVIDGVAMNETEHFTYKDNVLIVLNGFLTALDKGVYQLKINGDALITINVKDADAPAVDEDSLVNVAEKANVADLSVAVNLFGKESETEVKLNDTVLTAEQCEIAANVITVKADYLATLSYGEYTFSVVNANGQAQFTVKLGDKPQSTSENQNVTKFTHEAIMNEALRAASKGDWKLTDLELLSVVYYDYSETLQGNVKNGVISGLAASGDFGALTLDKKTMTFGFVRNGGWFGAVAFTYKVTDELGFVSDEITMDVVYKQNAPQIDGQNDKVYDKTKKEDITFTIINAEGNYDFAVNRIVCGSDELSLDVDYSIGGKNGNYRYFTVKSSYFDTVSGDSVTLTVYTDGGRADITIAIVEALTADNAQAHFDKASADGITFVLKGSPLIVDSLKLNDIAIDADDYDFANGALTITNEYLKGLSYGEHTFIVNNGYGDLSLTVTVTDSREPALSNSEIEYARGGSGVRVSLELYDKAFVDLQLGGGTAVSKENYSFANGVLAINGDYLNGIQEETLILTIVTSSNQLTLTISFTEVVVYPEVTAPTVGYEIDRQNDVEYSVDLKGNTFAGIKYGNNDLTEETDYSFNAESGVLTLKSNFLTGIYRFGTSSYSLTLLTYEGNDADFAVDMQNPENRILNGGFETGTLYGWNGYGIWKGESGMLAWTDDRVVSGGYFDQNYDYNKDGNYNIGIYGGNINKDSGQERMGHLRSANFTLGGSGWISFKLGGGRNSSFAYVSVRLASNNAEIARFGNPKFNTSTSTGNGEAYMFLYYFDLSEHLNEQMYFVLTDASSNEWCVLSADSFFTYYETAPDTSNGFLADNILPSIFNVDTADNSIKNGELSSNLDNWDNVNGIFRIDGDFTISDVGGDGATGVLRSGAFTLTDKKYVRFDWAGALKADKQLFVSVKEVGTNIEVLRFVRRDDRVSKQDGDFDNHMLDLSSLDGDKQYYIEFADNCNGSWGVSKIKNVRLVDEAEWNSVTDGDRAVSISGLNTTFEYILPYTA